MSYQPPKTLTRVAVLGDDLYEQWTRTTTGTAGTVTLPEEGAVYRVAHVGRPDPASDAGRHPGAVILALTLVRVIPGLRARVRGETYDR